MFQRLRSIFGDSTVDLTASSENAQEGPTTGSGEKRMLPFFSRYHCDGSGGVRRLPKRGHYAGENTTAFGYCFQTPVMVGHSVQRMPECGALAVIVLPDVRDSSRGAVVLALVLPNTVSFGHSHRQDRVCDYGYVRQGRRAVEINLKSG